MSIEQLEVPCVVDDAAHKVSCLLVVEEREIESLHLVIDFPADVADKVPGSPVGHVVAQKPEDDPEKIQEQYLHREQPYGLKVCFLNAAAHYPRQRGKHSGRSEVDGREKQSRGDGDDIIEAVPYRLPG